MRLLSLLVLCLPVLCGEAPTGKVFVQSTPAGADIFVVVSGELKDSGVNTPGLVELPRGPALITLRKSGFADKEVHVTVGAAIIKTEAVKLEPPKIEVEVTSTDPGWQLFIDGVPLVDKTGKRAVTPCTVLLPVGKYSLGFGKEGFYDVIERVAVDKSTASLNMKSKPRKGRSALLLAEARSFCGQWNVQSGNWSAVWTLRPDMKWSGSTGACRAGTWLFKDGRLHIQRPNAGTSEFPIVGSGPYRCVNKNGSIMILTRRP